MLSWFSSSGYSQSASLLAHNWITAPEFIRKSLHFSWYMQVLTHCLLLFATLQGTYLIQLNITEYKSHIREQARYAGRFLVRPHPLAQPWIPDTVESIALYKTYHTPQRTRKKACPERGSARGKTGFATLSAFPLANFRRETIPGSPHAVSQRYTYIRTLKCNTFNH